MSLLAGLMWEYLTVFVLAATPLLELLVVIPLGIGYGLDPVAVAVVTLVGNTLPVLGIVLAFERWQAWRQPREPTPEPGADEGAADAAAPASARWRRARRLWVRYGMPGLALLAPLLTGVHLASVVALALGSPRRAVARWMVASIGLWTAGVTIVTVSGIEAIRRLL